MDFFFRDFFDLVQFQIHCREQEPKPRYFYTCNLVWWFANSQEPSHSFHFLVKLELTAPGSSFTLSPSRLSHCQSRRGWGSQGRESPLCRLQKQILHLPSSSSLFSNFFPDWMKKINNQLCGHPPIWHLLTGHLLIRHMLTGSGHLLTLNRHSLIQTIADSVKNGQWLILMYLVATTILHFWLTERSKKVSPFNLHYISDLCGWICANVLHLLTSSNHCQIDKKDILKIGEHIKNSNKGLKNWLNL